MGFNYSKLKGRITEKCGTQAEFALRMELSERTISLKLNNQIAWKQNEICKAIKILALTQGDIQEYFFTNHVQNIEHISEDNKGGIK